MTGTLDTQEGAVFSYALASADLRYIEIGEREIYLRSDPDKGLVFQGEIAGCGPDCYVDLSEILLEYAMSCEGCSRPELASEMLNHFGDHLGQVYVEKTIQDTEKLDRVDKISSAINCILNSMDAKFIEDNQANHLEYSLECCPLSECAKDIGLNRSVEMAYLSFLALCNSLITKLAPGWSLVHPSAVEIDIPIHRILISQ